jgi:hypothetical protein
MFEGIKVVLTAVTGKGKIWQGRTNRAVEELRALWKGQITVRRDFEWIRLYFQYRQPEGRETVDDKTWSDLEMEEVFARIDRTTSVIGRQYLYALLRTYENDISELRRRARLYALFRADPTLRESIQKILYRLRHDSTAYITTLLFEELPRKPKYCRLLYLSSGLFFLALALTIFDPRFLVVAVALALVNLGINVRYGRAVFQHFSDLTQLTTMLAAAGRLARITCSKPVLELNTLRRHKDLAASLNRKVFWLCLDETQANEFAAAFFGFLNVFGLSRLIAFLRTVDDLRNFREQIRQIFDAIGSLDAHLAVASYLESLPLSVSPTFNSTGTIDVCGICHP